MALITCTIGSKSLGKETQFVAILPENAPMPLRTVYLLHGLSDNETTWLRRSVVELYAAEYGVAIIMPDGERSFYTDMVSGGNFFTYIADELVETTRKLFPLSHRREDTFIAGLSMGGYGAMKIALQRPETFAAAATFSGCVDIAGRMNSREIPLKEFAAIWGENAVLENTKEDLFWLAKNLQGETIKPRIYQECGTEDFLYADNVRFRDFLQTLDFDFHYEERPGEHNWPFWNVALPKALAFFLQ